MKIYKLNMVKIQERIKSRYWITFLLGTLAMGVGHYASHSEFNWDNLKITTPISGIAILTGIIYSRKKQMEGFASFTIKWDKKSITKSQIRTNDVVIKTSEIQNIKEIERGVIIKSKAKAILIPIELEGYNELLKELKLSI